MEIVRVGRKRIRTTAMEVPHHFEALPTKRAKPTRSEQTRSLSGVGDIKPFPLNSYLFNRYIFPDVFTDLENTKESIEGDEKYASLKGEVLYDAIFQRLDDVAELSASELGIAAKDAIVFANFDPNHARRMFHFFIYMLEREPTVRARHNIIKLISNIVIAEFGNARERNTIPHYTRLVYKDIARISYACDMRGGEVREGLHTWIRRWIMMNIFPAEFLEALRNEELHWTFSKARPTYEQTANDPQTLVLEVLGITKNEVDPSLRMSGLVTEGIARGQEEGWISIDEDGHCRVNVLKASEEQ